MVLPASPSCCARTGWQDETGDELDLSWSGPYSSPDFAATDGSPALPTAFGGVYLQAAECGGGYLIYCAGITGRPFRERFVEFYSQMSRMCGSTFLPNSSSAAISASGSSEPGVWNDRSTTPQPISAQASCNCPMISSGPPQKLIGNARLTLAGRRPSPATLRWSTSNSVAATRSFNRNTASRGYCASACCAFSWVSAIRMLAR